MPTTVTHSTIQVATNRVGTHKTHNQSVTCLAQDVCVFPVENLYKAWQPLMPGAFFFFFAVRHTIFLISLACRTSQMLVNLFTPPAVEQWDETLLYYTIDSNTPH